MKELKLTVADMTIYFVLDQYAQHVTFYRCYGCVCVGGGGCGVGVCMCVCALLLLFLFITISLLLLLLVSERLVLFLLSLFSIQTFSCLKRETASNFVVLYSLLFFI